MDRQWQIIVVSSELESRQRLAEILHKQDLDPICTTTIGQCREILAQNNVGLVFCDQQLTDGTYWDLLALASKRKGTGKMPIVLTANLINSDEYHEAKRSGIFDVITSPCHPSAVEWMVIRASRDDHNRGGHAWPMQSATSLGSPKTAVAVGKI
jgi:DNA-binding NtrC family response regulator